MSRVPPSSLFSLRSQNRRPDSAQRRCSLCRVFCIRRAWCQCRRRDRALGYRVPLRNAECSCALNAEERTKQNGTNRGLRDLPDGACYRPCGSFGWSDSSQLQLKRDASLLSMLFHPIYPQGYVVALGMRLGCLLTKATIKRTFVICNSAHSHSSAR
jgi:hypothetical protein